MSSGNAAETLIASLSGLVAVRASPIHGVGCFALARFAIGEYVAEYRGERITQAEAMRRDSSSHPRYSPYIAHLKGRWFIDGAVGGNEIRFINHSCDANCDLVLDDGRVFVAAARQIDEGEELTVDYAFDRGAGFGCNCNAPGCRGTPYSAERGDKS